ncbi:diacylglycerol kinase (ATP) [Kitasatospora sp. MAA4]|uniref:diacylglycerol/lipid kinase family protein n=1 Tax=Kitasatospora sp. MAA4 TaxID=3035093 RepID=UPI0024753299|nr:diacylglycerol kinase family protein [Kitasatospora sp. MAA4]MDH6131826.1 diacylglycerol kinase (ATP) [Kitasatospora sp. MAA4]
MGRWARRVTVIANPRGGTAAEVPSGAVVDRLERAGVEVRVVRTGWPGHASELAREAADAGVDAVVAVGGDGTASEVAAGLAGVGGTALMVVPAGTGNSFYREIWADRPWAEALDEAFGAGRPVLRGVDLARVAETGELALLGACSGLVAEALAVASGLGEVVGRDRYQQAVALTLRDFAPYPGRVSIDGELVHEGTVVLANVGGGRFRGGSFMVLPHSVLDDGLLDVCVVTGRLDPRELPGLTREGRHTERPEVVYRRGRSVLLERTDGEPLTFERDGEVMTGSATRYRLDVVPAALNVLAPG